jgi:hypothetical protein
MMIPEFYWVRIPRREEVAVIPVSAITALAPW